MLDDLLRKIFSHPKGHVTPYVCKLLTFSDRLVPEILRGSEILRWGIKFPLKLVAHFGVKVHALFTSVIVCDGGDCRCEVLLQSYSPSNVELSLRNAVWGGGWVDFTVERDLLIFGGALLSCTQTGYYVEV